MCYKGGNGGLGQQYVNGNYYFSNFKMKFDVSFYKIKTAYS